ncbi:hypothetical protein WICPIJ_009467, partial [Wickerhamomyces pijperi]
KGAGNGKEEIDTELQISHVFKREPESTQQVEDIDSDGSLSYSSSDEEEDEVPDEADEADISDSE